MPDITGTPSSSTLLRWTTLVFVAANLAFIVVYSSLSEAPTITDVVADFGNTFVPGGFAKAICIAILVAFLFFYCAALWPQKHRNRVYDKLVVPLALTSVLASSWFVAIRHEAVGLSAALIAAGVALAAIMFVRVASVSPGKHSRWLRVPFSLHFGAMTIALLVAMTQWLNVSGLLARTAMAPDDVATAFLAIAAATGSFIAVRYSDFIYPAVITSGVGAMFIAQRTQDPGVAADALIVCAGMLVVVGLAAVALAHKPRGDPKGRTSHRSTRLERRAKDEGAYSIDGNTSIMRF
jgi:hypothetical protein